MYQKLIELSQAILRPFYDADRLKTNRQSG